MKNRKGKKYNPHKVAGLVTGYAALVLHSIDDKPKLLDLRTLQPFRPTDEQLDVLLDRAHRWHIHTSIFMEVNGQHVIKTLEHQMTQPFKQADLVEYLRDAHIKQLKAERQDCVTGYGWIATPRPRALSESWIDRIYDIAAAIKA